MPHVVNQRRSNPQRTHHASSSSSSTSTTTSSSRYPANEPTHEPQSRPRFVPNQVCQGLPYYQFYPVTRADMNHEAQVVAQIKQRRAEDTERTFSGMRKSRARTNGTSSSSSSSSSSRKFGTGNSGSSSSSSGNTNRHMRYMTDKKGVNLVSALLRTHGFVRTSNSRSADVIWSFNRLKPSFHKALEKGQRINQVLSHPHVYR